MAEKFPTGKLHVSYSEVKAWAECPFRHYLMYVKGINTYVDNPYADFGTIVHEAIEDYLKGSPFDLNVINEKIDTRWNEKGYNTKEYIDQIIDDRKSNGWKYVHESIEDFQNSAKTIVEDFPAFMDETFPGWNLMSAEQQLYEPLNEELSFKGFIDCVIARETKPGSGKIEYWVIDWKTTKKTGWFWKKKKEFLSLAQVALYKQYWSNKFNIPVEDIKVAYVFLKTGAKPGKSIELFTFSSGPKFLQKANDLVNKMIINVKKGTKLKNYNNCVFCPYKNTEHCSGKGW